MYKPFYFFILLFFYSFIFLFFYFFILLVQGQCKPNAIEFIRIAEAPPELADES